MAAQLHGEPKTEMWYCVDADAHAHVFAGLKKGVARTEFETALVNGSVAEKIFSIPIKTGDSIFIPSGRIHAIGEGNVIFEVQQNSDTTYRVFDWNRLGVDGRPRALHVAESLQSIDFEDIEPAPLQTSGEMLLECEYFRVEKWSLDRDRIACDRNRFAVFTCLEGEVACGGVRFKPGDLFLVPACAHDPVLHPLAKKATVLRINIP
jgi:mannose-6-phosphate isomerase